MGPCSESSTTVHAATGVLLNSARVAPNTKPSEHRPRTAATARAEQAAQGFSDAQDLQRTCELNMYAYVFHGCPAFKTPRHIEIVTLVEVRAVVPEVQSLPEADRRQDPER